MRKILPAFSVLLILSLILAGCGGNDEPTTPGPSVRGTWQNEPDVDPPVTVIVRDYLGSREMTFDTPEGKIIIVCYFYSGEIKCSVYEGGFCPITAMPPDDPSSGSFIYAATMLGQNILTVQGIGEDPSDLVMFSGSLSGGTAQGVLMIMDGGTAKWNDTATFTRS